MKKMLTLTLLVVLLAVPLSAHAEGPATPPPPPPVTTPPPVDPLSAAKQIDAANARADQWQTVATQAMSSAQGAIDNAYASLYAAQASIGQMQIALQQSEAARVAAQQGQIAQAVASAQNAQLAGVQAVALSSAAGQSAMLSLNQSGEAVRAVSELRTSLTAVTAQRNTARSEITQLNSDLAQSEKNVNAVAGALVAERQRADLLMKIAIALFGLLVLLMSYITLILWRVARTVNVPSIPIINLTRSVRVITQEKTS
jgi:hypothetical protein